MSHTFRSICVLQSYQYLAMFISTGEPSFLLGLECHLPSVGIPGDFHFLPEKSGRTNFLVPFHCTFSPSWWWSCMIFSEVWKRLIPFLILFLECTGTRNHFTLSWLRSVSQWRREYDVTPASQNSRLKADAGCPLLSDPRTQHSRIPGLQTGSCVSQEYSA